jgi:hypothetical protein
MVSANERIIEIVVVEDQVRMLTGVYLLVANTLVRTNHKLRKEFV